MILRDYQSESVDFLVARKRGMVVAPAGSGKTVIGCAALARVCKPGWKVTWIAPTIEIVAQAGEALGRIPGPQGVNFNLVCAASLPDTSDSDVVVLDEAHMTPAAIQWLPAARKARGIVWGLSATPWSETDEERNIVMRDVFKEFFVIERDRVLASGHLVHGKVWIHDIDRPGQFDQEIAEMTAIETARRVRAFRNIPEWEHRRRAQWTATQEIVQKNEARNQHIIAMAMREKDMGSSVLLLVNSIEHGTLLAMQIPGAIMAHSKMGAKKRKEAIEGFRDGTVKVLVATQLADQGLDVPRANCLILAAGGRSAGKLEQRAGRVLRPFEGKGAGVIHDYRDAGASFALAQSRARMQTYERLGYEPDIVKHFSSDSG